MKDKLKNIFKKKNKNENEIKVKKMIKEEIKKELSSSSFYVSFGISVIAIGIISIWFKSNYSLLIGVAISSLLLSIISCYKSGNTLFNILPVFIMLLFGFFPKSIDNIPVIKTLLNEQYLNLIIFLSLGITILTTIYKNIKNRLNIRSEKIINSIENNEVIANQTKHYNMLRNKINNIYECIENNNINNNELIDSIESLNNYLKDEAFLSSIKLSLSKNGVDNETNNYSLKEIEKAIINYKSNESFYRNDEQVRIDFTDFK